MCSKQCVCLGRRKFDFHPKTESITNVLHRKEKKNAFVLRPLSQYNNIITGTTFFFFLLGILFTHLHRNYTSIEPNIPLTQQ